MFKKFLKSFRRLLLWLLVVAVGLPFGLAMMVKPARAAAKTEAASPKPAVKLSFVGAPTGLHRGNTYVAGQSIRFQLKISGSPTLVWAETGVLDPNFPATITFAPSSDGEGEGIWQLQTPRLSDDLNVGSNVLKIVAEDKAGLRIKMSLKITLERFTALTISSYKVTSDGRVVISWGPVSWADVYLVVWQIQDEAASAKHLRTKSVSAEITALEPGTFYEVKIQPLRGDAVGQGSQVIFQTLGQAPPKQVAGEQAVEAAAAPQLAPAIDEGVTTSRKLVQAPSKVSEEVAPKKEEVAPTPTPSPSPTPKEEEKAAAGGWSKMLVALSILIIAAGAAIGGYYGYEWLMLKGQDKDKEPPSSSSRW